MDGYVKNRNLKVVVDAGNGVAGLTGPQILRGLGWQVEELFCQPDGDFPNHHPDPAVEANLSSLKNRVIETKSDCGIAWDGDGDRIGVIDEKGNYIAVDKLLLLYAKDILNKKSEKQLNIVADVKCSDVFFNQVKKLGGNPILWKTGRAFIEAKVKEVDAALGGELAGHIFFNDFGRFYGLDDGAYCACRLLEILSRSEQKLSELVAEIPTVYSTPEVRIPCADEVKFSVVDDFVQKVIGQGDISCELIDGIRISFTAGWGLVRASNTEPVISFRVEATSKEKLKEYQDYILNLLRSSQEKFLHL